ncbi:MAG: alcohol dehydrogenase catalytic domain-containing protein [Acidobacteria bacterium]|nr:alcohol dehydrogenase catalytic domain-containing protein [Acidobacteriota bacterium]MCI0723177.1 alcohol dehydrogenase catalytic domain-containing protein [Acidobacteriota bacterium]
MQAAVLEAPSKIVIRDVPAPRPGPHELLVRVAAVGLCGTDIHIFRGEGNYNMDASGRVVPLEEQPQILGHEFCGEVVEVGGQAGVFQPGDRVVVDQGHNCHSVLRSPLCEYCQTGDSHQCAYYREHGITGLQGAMAEFVAVPARNAVRIPGNLTFLEAAMTEPLGCILHSTQMLEKTPARYTFGGERRIRSILICGSGPAGLLFAQCFRNVRGFDGQVIVADVQERKLDLAKRFGAVTVNLRQQPLIEAVRDLTGGQRVECLIDACGNAALFEQVPWLLRKQGTFVLYGHGHRGKDVGILNLVQFLEPVLVSPIGASGGFSADGSPLTYRRAVEAISSGKVDAGSMITHAYPGLDCVQKALSEDCREPGYVKGIVQMLRQ